eukprot:1291714-Pyramimonas_sp.AAC.1
MPSTQFGAVPRGGCDFATHTVLAAVDIGQSRALSIFVLFIDLTKAFDTIVREIAFGFSEKAARDPIQHLKSLGLTGKQAEWIHVFWSTQGPLLERWGLDPLIIELLRDAHAESWFSYGAL